MFLRYPQILHSENAPPSTKTDWIWTRSIQEVKDKRRNITFIRDKKILQSQLRSCIKNLNFSTKMMINLHYTWSSLKLHQTKNVTFQLLNEMSCNVLIQKDNLFNVILHPKIPYQKVHKTIINSCHLNVIAMLRHKILTIWG